MVPKWNIIDYLVISSVFKINSAVHQLIHLTKLLNALNIFNLAFYKSSCDNNFHLKDTNLIHAFNHKIGECKVQALQT